MKPRAAPTTFGARCGAAWATAAASLYFWSCVVYLVYTMQALAVDHCDVARPPSMVNTSLATPTGIADDPYSYSFYDYETPDPLCSEVGDSPINRQYVALAAVHLVSAFMYGAAWRGWLAAHAASAPLWARALILVPEAFNVASAALYIYTSTLYGPLSAASSECFTDPDCSGLHRLHRLELAAAALEMAAALLWAWSWWYTHDRGAGRGLTPLDPDFWATLLLLAPSAMYVAYNEQVIAAPETYGTNFLYKHADDVYFVGAVLYVVAALRDSGCFFWLPMIPGCAFDFEAAAANAAAAAAASAPSAPAQLVIRKQADAEEATSATVIVGRRGSGGGGSPARSKK